MGQWAESRRIWLRTGVCSQPPIFLGGVIFHTRESVLQEMLATAISNDFCQNGFTLFHVGESQLSLPSGRLATIKGRAAPPLRDQYGRLRPQHSMYDKLLPAA